MKLLNIYKNTDEKQKLICFGKDWETPTNHCATFEINDSESEYIEKYYKDNFIARITECDNVNVIELRKKIEMLKDEIELYKRDLKENIEIKERQNKLLNIVLPNYKKNYMTYEKQEECLKCLKEKAEEKTLVNFIEPQNNNLTLVLPDGVELVKQGECMIVNSKTTKTQIFLAIVNILAFCLLIANIIRGFVR